MRKLVQWYSNSPVYIKLSPFLCLYVVLVIVLSTSDFKGDEGRYLFFANNILNGFYSPPYPDINLWNGPGYPLLVSLFLLFKLPLITIKLFNAFLLYFSLIFVYKTAVIYSSGKKAIFVSILLGLYFPVYEMLPLILTECLAWFLISLFCYLTVKVFKESFSWKLLLIAALVLAYLAMVKIIFGQVIITAILVSVPAFLFKALRPVAKKALLLFGFSFLFCMPYLTYTYLLTNKTMYWGNSGSLSLYTMSSPYKSELGDWNNSKELTENENHRAFFDSISNLKPIEKSEALKKEAVKNIKEHPEKYFQNWLANLGRLFFSYPYSNTSQSLKTYFTFLPNMFLMVFMCFALFAHVLAYKKIPAEIWVLLFFVLVYLAGNSLVSAGRRMFYITLPFWVLYFSYIYTHIVTIRLKSTK